MAADNTTNKIKFDISELKAGITESNRLIKLANSEFKAAASGMDNWKNSTEGLEAKIKQLTTVQDQEQKKLDALKEQYKLVAAEQGENSAGAIKLATQINNQQAAVNRVAGELNQYEGRLGEVKTAQAEAERTGKSLEDVLRDMDSAANEAADAADDVADGYTVLKDVFADFVSSALQSAIEGFKDLAIESGKAMDKLQAATGATTGEMDKFRNEIYDLYKNNYGESLEDLGDKFAYIKQVTGETDPSVIKDLAKNAINLEEVFGSDFNESVRGIQNLMTHFGISADEAFDLFATGSQNGLDYTDELGDNIAEYGGNFAQAGYSADEYFQLLENGTKGGAYNLDKVNDSINEVKNRLGDGTIEKNISQFSDGTQDLFTQWQNGDADMKDVINSIVTDISSCTNEQEALSMAATAFGTMGEDANLDVVKSLTTLGDSYTDVKGKAEEVDKIAYDNLGSALSGLGRTLITELVQPIVDKVEPVLTKFVTWLIDNMPILKPIIVGLATAFGVLAGAAGIGKLVSMIPKLITLFKTLTATMMANPIVLIAAAIAGLVAAFIYLWNTSDKFRGFWKGLWSGLVSVFNAAKDGIISGLNAVKTFFTETIPNAFNAVINFFQTNWQALLLLILNPFVGVLALMYKNSEGFRAVVDKVVSFFKQLPGKIWNAIIGAVTKIAVWGTKMKDKATTAATKIVTTVITKIKTLPGKIWSAIIGAVTKIAEWGRKMKEKAKTAAADVVTAVVDKLKTLPGKIVSIGGDVIKGLWNGIKNKNAWLKGQIKGLVGDVKSWLKKFFKIGSPSRLMADEIGRWLPEGIAVGISDNAKSALNAMRDLGSNLLGEAELNGLNVPALSGATAAAGGAITNNYVFNQTNNSPSALSRLDIYRQTQNQLRQLKRIK